MDFIFVILDQIQARKWIVSSVQSFCIVAMQQHSGQIAFGPKNKLGQEAERINYHLVRDTR